MNMPVTKNLWCRVLPSSAACTVRLFCIPYAGGGANVFADWHKALPDYVEVCLITLPGREERLRELPYTRMPLMIKALWRGIHELLDMPCVFFGHSMGALIAFELAHYAQQKEIDVPSHLVVGGHRAPHLPSREGPMHALSEESFIDKLREYSGTPELLLTHPDFQKIYMPLLRADFAVCETYQYQSRGALNCPITVLSGNADPDTNAFEVASWKDHTVSTLKQKEFKGNHFFIHDSHKQVLSSVEKCIKSVVKQTGPVDSRVNYSRVNSM